MRIAIDLFALVGGLLIALGCFVNWGLGASLIYAGIHMTGFALLAAHAHKSEINNVPDLDETAES